MMRVADLRLAEFVICLIVLDIDETKTQMLILVVSDMPFAVHETCFELISFPL
jgi:hypothetical protein